MARRKREPEEECVPEEGCVGAHLLLTATETKAVLEALADYHQDMHELLQEIGRTRYTAGQRIRMEQDRVEFHAIDTIDELERAEPKLRAMDDARERWLWPDGPPF